MDIEIIAVISGLLAAIALGGADFLAAKEARFEGPMTATVAVNIVGALGFLIFYVLMFPFVEHALPASSALYTSIAALFLAAGQITLFKALELGPVSLVSPLTSIYPLFVALGVVFFFQAHMGLAEAGAIAIILLGTLTASGLFDSNISEKKFGAGPLLGILTAFFWGVGYIFLGKALASADWQTVSLIQLLAVAAICTGSSAFIGIKEGVLEKLNFDLLTHKYVLSTGLLQMAGMVVLNVGLSLDYDLVPVVTAVSACYPALTIMLALIYFKEEQKFVSLLGAFLCIVGIVLLVLNGG